MFMRHMSMTSNGSGFRSALAERRRVLTVQRKVGSSKRGVRFDSFCQDKSLGL